MVPAKNSNLESRGLPMMPAFARPAEAKETAIVCLSAARPVLPFWSSYFFAFPSMASQASLTELPNSTVELLKMSSPSLLNTAIL
jgi:hypothetical protein